MLKKVRNILIGTVLMALLLLPVGALLALSAMEQKEYEVKSDPVITLAESSYGTPSSVRCIDVYETITLSGTVISTEVIYQELDVAEPELLRLLVSKDQLMKAGDLIGYYQGQPLYATETGVIRSVNTGKEAYIELWSLDALAIECYVSESQLKVLQRGSLELTDADGNAYTVSEIETIRIGNKDTRVLLTSETATLTYGKSLSQFSLNTGRVYYQSTVVRTECLYTIGGITYVRLVNADGSVIGQQEVETGVTVGEYTCVIGLEEGQLCDPAYRSVIFG